MECRKVRSSPRLREHKDLFENSRRRRDGFEMSVLVAWCEGEDEVGRLTGWRSDSQNSAHTADDL